MNTTEEQPDFGVEVYEDFELVPSDQVDGSKDKGDLPPEDRPKGDPDHPPEPSVHPGDMRAGAHRKKKLVIPHRRTLKVGMKGGDVIAVSRALGKWEHRHHLGSYHEHPTPNYGKGKAERMARFQKRHGIKPTGTYTPATHRALLPLFDAWGAHLMQAYHPKPGLSSKRKEVVANAMFALHECGPNYTQDSFWRCQGYYQKIRPPHDWAYADCSGFALWAMWEAGIPTAKCGPYDGWTGSMMDTGREVAQSKAQPGDMVYYDNHVAVLVQIKPDRRVVTHGHAPGPQFTEDDYRDDIIAYRNHID